MAKTESLKKSYLRYHYYLRLLLQVMDRQEAKLLPESNLKSSVTVGDESRGA